MSVHESIDALNEDEIFEVARTVLSDKLNVAEPQEAAQRAAEALNWEVAERAALREEVESVALHQLEPLVALLRLALHDAADQDAPRIRSAIQDAGRRQTVVGLDLIVLGGFLLLTYVVVKSAGRDRVIVEETKETDAKGEVKVSRKETTVYLDPLSSLGKLIRRAYSDAPPAN